MFVFVFDKLTQYGAEDWIVDIYSFLCQSQGMEAHFVRNPSDLRILQINPDKDVVVVDTSRADFIEECNIPEGWKTFFTTGFVSENMQTAVNSNSNWQIWVKPDYINDLKREIIKRL